MLTTLLLIDYSQDWLERMLKREAQAHKMSPMINKMLGDNVQYAMLPSREFYSAICVCPDDDGYTTIPAKIFFKIQENALSGEFTKGESELLQKQIAEADRLTERGRKVDLTLRTFDGMELVKTIRIKGARCIPNERDGFLSFEFEEGNITFDLKG